MQLPAGMNQDEATTGVDAYNLLHFGMDRSGSTFPVELVGFGSGISAFATYLTIPSVAIFGLTPFAVRFPILLISLLTIPLVFFIGKALIDETLGYIAMFLLAICPWHIMLSRWGLDANTLPFLFTLSFALLIKSTNKNHWAIPAFALLSLCLYTYGSAYVAVPVFVVLVIPVLLASKKINLPTLIWALIIFILIAIPIGLFLTVNYIGLESIHWGVITIPRLPVQARFLSESTALEAGFWKDSLKNFEIELFVLLGQRDGSIWNGLNQYGYFYLYTFPIILIGQIMLIPRRKARSKAEKFLLLAWIASAFCIGLLEQANINRINLIFIPLILSAAVVVHWLWRNYRPVGILFIAGFLVGFTLFTIDYYSDATHQQMDVEFNEGLLPALQFAREKASSSICVTDHVNMPYIYVLFNEKMNPLQYLDSIEYGEEVGGFRKVNSLANYTFGVDHCIKESSTVYVLRNEALPAGYVYTEVRKFGEYRVYLP